jgi:uncharacterized protein YdcH (DUF465 family)
MASKNTNKNTTGENLTLSDNNPENSNFKDSTEILQQSILVVKREVSEYSTVGKTYPTLCRESLHFKTLFKLLNELNEDIKTSDRSRKEAIKNCPRPVSKSKDDAFIKRIKEMSQEELDQLRRKP